MNQRNSFLRLAFVTLVSLILLLVDLSGQVIAAETTKYNPVSPSTIATTKTLQDFKVKLPDGLYLFQPFVSGGRFVTRTKDVVSPLVIVEKGKLVDPFVQFYQIGKERFHEVYLNGNIFNVYVWPQRIGEIRNIQLAKATPLHSCVTQGIFPNISDIQGHGDYRGKPLFVTTSAELTHKVWHMVPVSLKPVITPETFQVSKEEPVFSITEEDKTQANEAIRRDIVPKALKYLRQRHASVYEKHMGRDLWKFTGEYKNKSLIVWLLALDVNGNGRRDLIGIYTLAGKSVLASNSSISEDHSINVLFVLKDTGRAEKVAYSDYMHLFKFGGVLDINGDGILEIILEDISLAGEGGIGTGKQIKIFSFIPEGWISIYETTAIGCE